VTWGTNALTLGSTVISGGTWQGGTIQTAYGGTGLTSYTSGGAVYANSTTTLTSGTLPLTAGGTAATTAAGARTSLDVPSTSGSGATGTWGISITGSASGSAGSVVNAATFNNGGAGDASGTTFNGSAARTISYNTIGAPSTTGTNASGSWGISVTGTSSNITAYTINQNLGTGNQVTFDSVITGNNGNGTNFRLGDDAWIGDVNIANTTRLQGVQSAASGYLIFGNGDNTALGRAGTGALTYGGNAVLTAGNYNSYAPTLTGGGASGTWGINITGSAGSAGSSTSVSATTSTGIQSSYSTTINTTTPGLANYGIVFSGPAIADYAQGITWGWSGTNAQAGIYVQSSGAYGTKMYFGTTDAFVSGSKTSMSIDHVGVVQIPRNYLQSDSSLRAPIFYDSNNTAYYVDPASTSNVINMLAGASSWYVPASRLIVGSGSGTTSAQISWESNGYYTGSIAMTSGGAFVWGGQGSSSWDFRINCTYNGDYSASGTSRFSIDSSGNSTSVSSSRAPIFYDSDNTAYYVNPASTSTLQVIESNGQDVAYTARRDVGASSWSARIVSTNYSYNVSAFLGNYNGYAGLFGHNASLSAWSPIYINAFGGTAQANVYLGNMYSPILYDLNDTGYYLDPNGTSNLNVLSDPALSDSRLYLRGKGDTNHYLWNATDDWEEMVMYFGTGFRVVNSQGNGTSLTCFGSSNGNYVQAAGSMRAPIFYDSENTAYYCDPTGFSSFQGLDVGTGSGGNQRILFRAGNDSSSYSALRFSYAGSETMQIHVFGPNWQGGSFTGASAGAINLSGQNGVTFGSWPSVNAWVNTSGNFQSNGDFRAPIFYDSNNTGYYLNMDGGSNMATTLTGYIYFLSNRNTNTDSPPLQAFSNNGGGAIMSFHRGGYYAINMGLDSDNVFRIGGWSAGINRLQMDMSGNLTMAGNVTAYSDERLKKDWALLPDDFLRRLAQVKSGTYTRIDSDERQVGVSAQGLQEFLEEAVQTDADGMLSVNYGGAALASAVELAKYVTALEQRIAQLEARL
jgi:hypothetical protein